MNNQRPLILFVFIIVLVAVAVVLQRVFPETLSPQNSPELSITTAADEAFGELEGISAIQEERSSLESTQNADAADAKAADIRIFPETTNIQFAVPTDLPLLSSTVDVLLWDVPALRLSELIKRTDLGVIDIGGMLSGEVQHLAVRTRDGYRADINLQEGSFSVYEEQRTLSDDAASVTVDEDILALANAFVDSYGIDRTLYGSPVLEKNDVTAFMETRDLEFPVDTVSSSATVTYPMTIDGIPVYATWGGQVGIQVTIDLVRGKVTGMSGVRKLSFVSSSYTSSTAEEFTNDIAHGGSMGYVAPTGVTPTLANLGSPEKIFLVVYKYDETRSDEILVPGYRFPVVDDTTVGIKEIFVPLVPNLFPVYDLQQGVGTEPAEASGTSGSAASGAEDAPESLAPDSE